MQPLNASFENRLLCQSKYDTITLGTAAFAVIHLVQKVRVMSLQRRSRFVQLAAVFGFVVSAAASGAAQLPEPTSLADGASSRNSNLRLVAPEPRAVAPSHPLAAVLQYARQEEAYLHQNVRDFTCRLVKRERIDGSLQDYQFIDVQLREPRSAAGASQPLSIFMRFMAPSEFVGRRVLYVAGQNDGKMLVRKGGKRFEYVVVELNPLGDAARDQSLVPVTECGFSQILGHMIQILEQHAQTDPTGENTKVQRIAGAKINNRPCDVVRITHPVMQKGLRFHVANVFVDDELHVPVRVDFSEWPLREGQPPRLTAEYTYTDLKLNVNLTDAAFDPSLLRVK